MSLDRRQLDIISKGTFPIVNGMKRLQIDSISPEIKAQDISSAFEKSFSPDNRLGMLVFGNLSITDATKLILLCKSKIIEHVSLCFAETPKESIDIIMQSFQKKSNMFELHLGKLSFEAIESIFNRLQETSFHNLYLDFYNGLKNTENQQKLITIATLLASLTNKNNISVAYAPRPNGMPTFVRIDKFIKENLPVNFSQEPELGSDESKESPQKRKRFSEEEDEMIEQAKFHRSSEIKDAPAAREAYTVATASFQSSNNAQPVNNVQPVFQLPQAQPHLPMQMNAPSLQLQPPIIPYSLPILSEHPVLPPLNHFGFPLLSVPLTPLESPVSISPVPMQETSSGDSDKAGNINPSLELKQVKHKKDKYKKQLEQQHQELKKALAELYPLKKDNKTLKYANEKLQQQVEMREHAFHALQSELAQIKSRFEKSKINNNGMAQRLAESLSAKGEFEEKLLQANQELARTKLQITQVQEELNNNKRQLNVANQTLAQTKQELQKNKNQLHDEMEKSKKSPEKQLKAELAEVNKKLSDSIQQAARNKEHLEAVLKDLKESKTLLSNLAQEAIALKQQSSTTQGELEQAKRQLMTKNQELVASKQRFDRDQKEILQLKEKLRIATEKQNESAKKLEAANTELAQLKSSMVPQSPSFYSAAHSNSSSGFFSGRASQMGMQQDAFTLQEDEDPLSMHEISKANGKS